MSTDLLLKRLQTTLEQITRSRMYGSLEIEFKAGEPVFMRKTENEKLDESENRTHGIHRR